MQTLETISVNLSDNLTILSFNKMYPDFKLLEEMEGEFLKTYRKTLQFGHFGIDAVNLNIIEIFQP